MDTTSTVARSTAPWRDFHARVVQHEVDHLDGILYPMRMADLRNLGFEDVLFPDASAVAAGLTFSAARWPRFPQWALCNSPDTPVVSSTADACGASEGDDGHDDSDGLDPDSWNELRTALLARSSQLREEIRHALVKSDSEQYVQVADSVRDLEDESFADLVVDVNLAEIDRDLEELRAVEDALLHVGDGSYGVCEECDRPIDIARLRLALGLALHRLPDGA